MTKTKTLKSNKCETDLALGLIAYENGDALAAFNEHKEKIKLEESFKIKGKLYELFSFTGLCEYFFFIFIDGKLNHFDACHTPARLYTRWETLVGINNDKYYNGCPHYTIDNAKEVEVICTTRRFLEFHKIASGRTPGCPLKSNFQQIPNTPYLIGNSIVSSLVDGKNVFRYEKDLIVVEYDFEKNLQNNRRFNLKYLVNSAFAKNGTIQQVLDKLVEHVEKEKNKFTTGYFNDGMSPWVWIEPNLKEVQKKQAHIDAIKSFKLKQ